MDATSLPEKSWRPPENKTKTYLDNLVTLFQNNAIQQSYSSANLPNLRQNSKVSSTICVGI